MRGTETPHPILTNFLNRVDDLVKRNHEQQIKSDLVAGLFAKDRQVDGTGFSDCSGRKSEVSRAG